MRRGWMERMLLLLPPPLPPPPPLPSSPNGVSLLDGARSEPFSRQHVLPGRLPRGPRQAARPGLAGGQPLPPDCCCRCLEWTGTREADGRMELEWLGSCFHSLPPSLPSFHGYDAIPGSGTTCSAPNPDSTQHSSESDMRCSSSSSHLLMSPFSIYVLRILSPLSFAVHHNFWER